MATKIINRSFTPSIIIAVLVINAFVYGEGRRPRNRFNREHERPNIVIIMTDDQDSELGSMNYMPKTRRILEAGGVKFTNAFTNSPICCPSRSSFLTGLHVHNHNIWTNNVNCSSKYWQTNFEVKSFATYLQDSGYKTGYFGKYLNEYVGDHIPAGWREWMGLVKNSAFYNYTVNYNGDLIKHGDDYHDDYFTDLIANDSLAFFKSSKLSYPSKPVAMVLSMPAPHGPEDSAPQYSDMFQNITDHRTPSWNYAPNPDKELLLQITGKMEPIQSQFADLLMRKRVMTLQSVDDAVEKVYNELSDLGELNNTYMIYLSDHGYHLGQFGIPKGKSMPYEFDIRIPMYARGPGIKPGSQISNLVGIIDIAPTLLDIAQVTPPDHMDGKSLKPLLEDSNQSMSVQRKAWRDTFLIERGKLRKQLINTNGITENFLSIYFNNNGGIESKCDKPRYQYPCKADQKFYCHKDSLDRRRIRKCNKLTKKCPCKENKRVKRNAEEKLVKKCSVIEGEVKCRRVEANGKPKGGRKSQRVLSSHQKALDDLIRDYKQQLVQLRILREDLQNDLENIDLDKYKLPAHNVTSDDVKRVKLARNNTRITTSLQTMTTPQPLELECLCAANEDELNEVDPKDLVREINLQTTSLPVEFVSTGLSKRDQKRIERQKKRDEKKQLRRGDKEICDEGDRICLRRQRKKAEFSKRNNPHCQVDGVECTIMDNSHWKTEPKWDKGPFCFCNNAQSNVFWCLRVLNETDNFLYCEYINDFLSYFDINKDPWQLRNAIHDLSYTQLGQLHNLLIRMRKCKGAKECTYRHRNRLASSPVSGRSYQSSPVISPIPA